MMLEITPMHSLYTTCSIYFRMVVGLNPSQPARLTPGFCVTGAKSVCVEVHYEGHVEVRYVLGP